MPPPANLTAPAPPTSYPRASPPGGAPILDPARATAKRSSNPSLKNPVPGLQSPKRAPRRYVLAPITRRTDTRHVAYFAPDIRGKTYADHRNPPNPSTISTTASPLSTRKEVEIGRLPTRPGARGHSHDDRRPRDRVEGSEAHSREPPSSAAWHRTWHRTSPPTSSPTSPPIPPGPESKTIAPAATTPTPASPSPSSTLPPPTAEARKPRGQAPTGRRPRRQDRDECRKPMVEHHADRRAAPAGAASDTHRASH